MVMFWVFRVSGGAETTTHTQKKPFSRANFPTRVYFYATSRQERNNLRLYLLLHKVSIASATSSSSLESVSLLHDASAERLIWRLVSFRLALQLVPLLLDVGKCFLRSHSCVIALVPSPKGFRGGKKENQSLR